LNTDTANQDIAPLADNMASHPGVAKTEMEGAPKKLRKVMLT